MPFAQYNRKKSSRFGSGKIKSSSFDTDRVNRSIENARTRIEDAGFKPEDTDQRNFFEKATNLPENQNAFFDILELLGRPSQGVLNVIKDVPVGNRTAGDAFLRGLTGRSTVRGSDIIADRVSDDKLSQTILGTLLEVGTDPLNLVPVGGLAKGVRAVASPVGRGFAKFAKKIEPEAVRRVREDTIQPLSQRGRDALGRAFIPDYKLDETLQGTKDDTIANLKQDTENAIRFQTEESMKKVADAAKVAGGIEAGEQVGRTLEAPLKQFEDVEGIQKEIPRPERELSTDPNIQQAAKNLLESNNELRQWSIDTGVNVSELEGYMKHVLAAEERKRRKNLKALPIDRGNFGTGQPNKKVIAQRENMGSVEDINERKIASGQLKEGEKFFEPNAFFATAIGQKQLIEYVNAVNFRKKVLTNPNFAQPYTKGDAVPNNAVVIDSNNYKFLKDTDEGEDIVQPSEIGGEYIVTKAVKQALDRYQRLTTDEGINSFLNAWDSVQSSWKRLALFSIPYHLRNDIGAKFNNWVGGMNTVDLVKYSGIADKEVYDAVIKGQESPLYREFREQGLGSTSVSQIEFAKRGEDAEKAIERTIRKRSQNDGTLLGRVKTEVKDLKNPLNAFETSQEFGAFIDQTNRFALFKWFVDKNKDKIKDTNELYRMAAKKVRTVQFDYTRMTPLEREVFTRVVPFYRWMRNNIPYQIRSFINDPRKYANINKLRLNAQDAVGIDEENVPEWMKESFAIPVTGDGSGSGQFLGLNLPLSDLNKISNPLKTTVDAVSPLAKLPAELSLNRNFFFNSPIEKFEGQEKQFQVPGTDQEFGIDQTLAYVLEQLTGQIGRGLSGFLQQPEDEDQDKKFRTPSLGISSILKDFDAEKSQYYQQLDELQKLMDLIDYIEQQTGQRPRTINEIN